METEIKKGILLVNLGSPSSANTGDIRSYLKEFLSDKRVMTMPALVRWMIVNLFILPFRPSKIQKAYESILTDKGFPLILHGEELAKKVNVHLGDAFFVKSAMRYGNPSLFDALEEFQLKGVEKILILPLFPQYASATTGSIIEAAMNIIRSWLFIPEISIVSSFFQHPNFITAWLRTAEQNGFDSAVHTVFSFHGLPESHIQNGDITGNHCLKSDNCCTTLSEPNHGCYRAQCFHTAWSIAKGLGILEEQFSISFQSRLGRTKWLEPYTVEHVKALAGRGIKQLQVFCPSFVADCLETTYEIQTEIQEAFFKAGGEKLNLIPSLNSSESWVQAIVSLVEERI